MKYKLQCEFCHEVFTHIGSSFPDECPLCHAYVGLDGKPEVTLPFLSSSANKSPDKMYRAMEEGAQYRIDMAAEATGLPASDFAHMKQTNMRDNLREGDVTHINTAPSNMQATFSGTSTPEQAAYAAGVRSGPFPNQGAAQIPKIQQLHREHGHKIVARGTTGKY